MASALADRVVLVTGATSGIGFATVRVLADEGARVHAIGRRREVLEERVRPLGRDGSVAVHAVDVTDEESVQRLVTDIGSQHPLDAVVCSAGTNLIERRLDQLTADSWRHLVETNLTGVFTIVHATLRQLRRTRGHVVVLSSVSAAWPDFTGPAYQASKAGVLAFVRGAAVEEHANGVRFTAVLPGMVNTELLDRRPNPPSEQMRALALQPEDVATAIVQVLSLPPRCCVAELTIVPTIMQSVGSVPPFGGQR